MRNLHPNGDYEHYLYMFPDQMAALGIWALRRPECAETALRFAAETLGLSIDAAREIRDAHASLMRRNMAELDEFFADEKEAKLDD